MKIIFIILILPFSIHACDLGAALATLHYAFQQRQEKEQETGSIETINMPLYSNNIYIDFPLASYEIAQDKSDLDQAPEGSD